MRERKFNLLELREQQMHWDIVCEDYLDVSCKEIYHSRKMAVDLYIEGYPLKEISKKSGIAYQSIYQLVERCLLVNNKTGKSFGYSALLPYKRIIKDKVNINDDKVVKVKGSFNQLLLKYPSLIKFVENNYFGKAKNVLEKNINISTLHQKFLEQCRMLKIQDYEYPFNTKDFALRTFYKYIRTIEIEKSENTILRQNNHAKQKYYSTGKGLSTRPIPLAPYSVVQLDGHKIDMLYTVEVQNKHGEIELMPATRMWLIAVIDVATRVIIGYSVTPNENYNQTDVLRAIRNSIMPKQPIEFTLGNLTYPENYGYPSFAIKNTEWAMFDTIMLDNAKSHLAGNVIDKLSNSLHCSLNFGSVATPEIRGIVERVFKTLEEGGYHRLPSTTGSNINDPRRENAEKDAVKYRIRYNDIIQLTEYFIALYNNSPHSALDNQTPLQCMERRVNDAGMKPFIVEDAMKDKIYSLTNITQLKTIRGSMENGKRPYITYKGVEYRNDILSQSMGLIGQNLIVEINPDDIRTINAYFSDGSVLGLLTAVGEWGRKAHSLKTREEAIKLANKNKQKNNKFYAPLTELENELNERAKHERRARTKAARIRKEQNKELLPKSEKNLANIVIMPAQTKQNNREDNKNDAVYTKEELEAILNADSIEDAFSRGLL